jgi:hypothetical protein
MKVYLKILMLCLFVGCSIMPAAAQTAVNFFDGIGPEAIGRVRVGRIYPQKRQGRVLG